VPTRRFWRLTWTGAKFERAKDQRSPAFHAPDEAHPEVLPAIQEAHHARRDGHDGGGALTSLKSRTGNCQTHARLYTALARAAGIPTRFVSGLVHLDGKGFLYHSWAESLLNGRWVAVDPTYNQVPTDPTHLKFFEGHLPEDMSPIIAIIGRIKINVLEAKY